MPPDDEDREGHHEDGGATEDSSVIRTAAETVRSFTLTVVEGPEKDEKWQSASDHCSIGSHPSNDFTIDDPTVSRFHCEIRIDKKGARIRDIDSRNGTMVDGLWVNDGYLRGGCMIRLGRSAVRFQFGSERHRVPVSSRTEFGSLVGTSNAMRTVFALLEMAAESDATVLIEGETGTGKEGAAEAVHAASARRDKPFITVDCSAIPENLMESEMFGHERGAFTGAAGRRVGAFEEASSGTIFLDEIGELPQDLQPKLLRVLEQREIRRIGSNVHQPVDVRVIAATNRDLRTEVNAGRFRSDLYFRLAVVKIPLPPLRNRPDDIPILAERVLKSLNAKPDRINSLMTPELVASMQHAAWPGNVRELRNYLERCLVFREPLPVGDVEVAASDNRFHIDARISYDESRRRAVNDFEREYVRALLKLHSGNVSEAARAAGLHRVYLHRLISRHQLKDSV
jgi:two-component system response regulator GlrR